MQIKNVLTIVTINYFLKYEPRMKLFQIGPTKKLPSLENNPKPVLTERLSILIGKKQRKKLQRLQIVQT